MARRRAVAGEVGQAGGMPAELRRRPVAEDEIEFWLDGDRMPADWEFGGEVWWRNMTAHQRWSRAQHAWRVEYDRSYWWYWRSRDLPVPTRSQREAYGVVPETGQKPGAPAGEGEGQGMAEQREQLPEVDRGMA